MSAALLPAVLIGCAPSPKQCRELMPVPVEQAVPTDTPNGNQGCTAIAEGVTLTIEAKGITTFSRHRIWINGVETPDAEFSGRFEQAKVEARIGKAASQIKGVIKGVQEKGKEVVDSLKEKDR
jgi:hypothetical protein